MSSLGVSIAEDVAAVLEGAELGMPFTVERTYATHDDVTEVIGVEVVVIPDVLAVAVIDLRPRLEFQWIIQVVVRSKVGAGNAAVDPLMDLVQGIILLFAGKPLGATPRRCIGVENNPACHHDKLDAFGLFESTILLTIRDTL